MTDQAMRRTTAGKVRQLSARWVIEATLTSLQPIHVGSGDEGGFVDLELLRDRSTNRPLLPGSSLAGGLRDHLCARLAGDRARETSEVGAVARLFGGRPGDPRGIQSPLIVFDALGSSSSAEIRDYVRLNSAKGTAKKGGKFDMEVWAPGTAFEIRLDLLVPASYDIAKEADCLALLAVALNGIGDGDVVVGAKGNRGFGRCQLGKVKAIRYALAADADGWKRYLATGTATRDPQGVGTSGADRVVDALVAAWPDTATVVQDAFDRHRTESATHQLVIHVDVECPDGILMGGAEAGIAGADRRHIHSAGRPVITGTGLAGALRQRARRIAADVRGTGEGDEWVAELFGSEPNAPGVRGMQASRLSVDEVPLYAGTSLQVTRIKLDRFTQAPVEGALLQEEPVYRSHARLRFRLRLPPNTRTADALAGLFVLTLKDLLLGDVPIGGTVGAGRGILRRRPDGVLSLRRGHDPDTVWSMNSEPPQSFKSTVEGWVRVLHDASVRPAGVDTEVAHA